MEEEVSLYRSSSPDLPPLFHLLCRILFEPKGVFSPMHRRSFFKPSDPPPTAADQEAKANGGVGGGDSSAKPNPTR